MTSPEARKATLSRATPIDFSATKLKLSDIQIVDVADGTLLRYGTDSILLKGTETIHTDQFIFG